MKRGHLNYPASLCGFLLVLSDNFEIFSLPVRRYVRVIEGVPQDADSNLLPLLLAL